MPFLTKSELAGKIDAARSAQGEFVATYKETVTTGVVPERGQKPATDRVTLSWGKEDGERTIEVGYKDGKCYWKCQDFFSSGKTEFGAVSQRAVWSDNKYTVEHGGYRMGQQGEISLVNHAALQYNPSLSHLQVNGRWLSDLIRGASSYEELNNQVLFESGPTTYSLSLDAQANVYRVQQFRQGTRVGDVRIGGWMTLATGGKIPQKVERETFGFGGSRINLTTYQLQNVKNKTDKDAFEIKWRERTLVEDHINGKHLIQKNGHLVVNHQFDQDSRINPLWIWLTVGALILLTTGFVAGKISRRRQGV